MTPSALIGHVQLWPRRAPGQQLVDRRPRLTARALTGLSVAHLPQRAASLFNLCGNVHQLCSHHAVAVLVPSLARRADETPSAHTSTHQRLEQECLREHVRRLALDWPTLWQQAGIVGVSPHLAKVLLDQALQGPVLSPAFALAGQRDAARHWLEQNWLEQSAESWWSDWCVDGWTAWRRWLHRARGPLTTCLRAVQEAEPLADWQPAAVRALPGADALDLRILAAASPGEAPRWQGQACHTGPWSRLMARQLWPQEASGLSGLIAARLIETVVLCLERPEPWLHWQAQSLDAQHAVACMDTARGLLVYRLQIEDTRVVACDVHAPTDWNLHPEGDCAQALVRIAAHTRDAELPAALCLLMSAFDPCTPYRVHTSATEAPQHA